MDNKDIGKLSKYAAKKLRQARDAARRDAAPPEPAPEQKAAPPKAHLSPVASATRDPERARQLAEQSLRHQRNIIIEACRRPRERESAQRMLRNVAEAANAVATARQYAGEMVAEASGAWYGEMSGVAGMLAAADESLGKVIIRLRRALGEKEAAQ